MAYGLSFATGHTKAADLMFVKDAFARHNTNHSEQLDTQRAFAVLVSPQ